MVTKASRTGTGAGRARPRTAAKRTPGSASPRAGLSRPGPSLARWTFLTNHSHVLILLAREPSLVLRDVALRVGITERAVQRIIADLEEAGFLQREKVGRQNHYRLRTDQPLRHPIESHCTIGELIDLVAKAPET